MQVRYATRQKKKHFVTFGIEQVCLRKTTVEESLIIMVGVNKQLIQPI